MRQYALKKQTRRDFDARLRRLDPDAAQGTEDKRSHSVTRRPIVSLFAGFGWIYLVITVARNRTAISDSLVEGSLPNHYHIWIFAGLAVLLAVSGVMLLTHMARVLFKDGAKRSNSRGVLLGAVAAGGLIYTPPAVVEAGFTMLDTNSRALLRAAHSQVKSTVPGVDRSQITMVSAYGK